MKTPLFISLLLLFGGILRLMGADPRAEGQLDKLLMNLQVPASNPDSQLEAAWELGLIGPSAKKAVPALVKIIVSSEEHPKARMSALNAVGHIGTSDKDVVDRLVFYAAWGALRALLSEPERKSLLADERPGVRRAALLSLLEDDALDVEALGVLANDSDATTAGLARRRWGGKAEMVIPSEAGEGEVYSGILLEESGVAFKIGLSNGESVTLPRSMIQKRETSRQSAMPSNYAELLTAQQIADITAFLRAAAPVAQAKRSGVAVGFKVQRGDGHFDVFFEGKRVATYVFDHPQIKRPAFINLRTASGIPVTREIPAPEGADHAWMHPGIAMSFGWLDGHDYWRFKAKVEHAAFLQEPKAGRDQLTWAVRNRYLSEDGSSIVCLEESHYGLGADSAGLLLQIDSTFFNEERDFCFGDQEESGLCIRVADSLRVKGGSGTILNDRGEENESGTWGREFQWIDYSGIVGSTRVGMLIVPHAGNPRACWSHSRDYGVLVANPFPRQPQERREPYVKTWVQQGQRYRLRFSVLIYETAEGSDQK